VAKALYVLAVREKTALRFWRAGAGLPPQPANRIRVTGFFDPPPRNQSDRQNRSRPASKPAHGPGRRARDRSAEISRIAPGAVSDGAGNLISPAALGGDKHQRGYMPAQVTDPGSHTIASSDGWPPITECAGESTRPAGGRRRNPADCPVPQRPFRFRALSRDHHQPSWKICVLPPGGKPLFYDISPPTEALDAAQKTL